MKHRYNDAMKNHIIKGHVSMTSKECKRWFLPHHPVINPRKPDKLGVVFDCAASMEGNSLNDALLQGPDWFNKLTGVLLRFRRYPIAPTVDIKEMFLQVGLPSHDRWAFSFLWWTDGNLNATPDVYEWNVHPFGAKSFPFCTKYALRCTAIDSRDKYQPATINAIYRDFYVDDYLASVEEASC